MVHDHSPTPDLSTPEAKRAWMDANVRKAVLKYMEDPTVLHHDSLYTKENSLGAVRLNEIADLGLDTDVELYINRVKIELFGACLKLAGFYSLIPVTEDKDILEVAQVLLGLIKPSKVEDIEEAFNVKRNPSDSNQDQNNIPSNPESKEKEMEQEVQEVNVAEACTKETKCAASAPAQKQVKQPGFFKRVVNYYVVEAFKWHDKPWHAKAMDLAITGLAIYGAQELGKQVYYRMTHTSETPAAAVAVQESAPAAAE